MSHPPYSEISSRKRDVHFSEAPLKPGVVAGELGFAPIEVGKIGEGGRLIQARNALVFQDLIEFVKQ